MTQALYDELFHYSEQVHTRSASKIRIVDYGLEGGREAW